MLAGLALYCSGAGGSVWQQQNNESINPGNIEGDLLSAI